MNGDPGSSDAALEHYLEMVEPTVQEFYENLPDRRRGFLAAIMLVHMADHYWHARPEMRAGTKREMDFVAYLAGQHADFHLLRDVAFAAKHGVLKSGILVTRADQVQDRAGNFAWAAWPWGVGPSGGGEFSVYVQQNDGAPEVQLRTVIHSVQLMWRERLGLS
jgi:hypothetical protein